MKLKLSIFILFVLCLSSSIAQLSEKELTKYRNAESELKKFSDNFVFDSIPFEARVKNIHDFIPRFVAILEGKNSFHYPFENLTTISKVVAPDNSFRVFTWQLKEPLGTTKYYGALQLNSKELKLFPLFDYSDTLDYQTQKILTHDNWYGGLYYKCLMHELEGTVYYTLFAFDDADFVSNRKFMEVLTFKNDKPVFGADIFNIPKSEYYDLPKYNRFFIEYNDEAPASFNYNEEMEMVLFDHLVPPSDKQDGAKFTYISDGTYEGFKWVNGKWVWKEKIFHYDIGENDKPPLPNPVLDNRD